MSIDSSDPNRSSGPGEIQLAAPTTSRLAGATSVPAAGVCPDFAKSEIGKAEIAKSEAAKSEAVKSEAAKSEAAKSEIGEAEVAKADIARATDPGLAPSAPAPSDPGEAGMTVEARRRIGRNLRLLYAEVLSQPLPDRFDALLADLAARSTTRGSS